MKITWLTDIHLEFVDPPKLNRFIESVRKKGSDAVLISGDIGVAENTTNYLTQIAAKCAVPIYFVLGNHDFYRGSIKQVRANVSRLCQRKSDLFWLSEIDPVWLNKKVALVGHDGWGDGRYGSLFQSKLMLNDFELIDELSYLLFPTKKMEVLNRLGDEAAQHIENQLNKALPKCKKVVVLTHVPPFPEASRHAGGPSDDHGLPYFACKAVGDILVKFATSYPNHSFLVLCGHTHNAAHVHKLPNLEIKCGGARYGSPKIQEVLDI